MEYRFKETSQRGGPSVGRSLAHPPSATVSSTRTAGGAPRVEVLSIDTCYICIYVLWRHQWTRCARVGGDSTSKARSFILLLFNHIHRVQPFLAVQRNAGGDPSTPTIPKRRLSCLDSSWVLKQVMCRHVHPWCFVFILQQGLQIGLHWSPSDASHFWIQVGF